MIYRTLSLLSLAAIVLVNVSCRTIGIDYSQPCFSNFSDAWSISLESHVDEPAELQSWWKEFNDASLNELIVQTHDNNPEFRGAAQKILELRAQRSATNSTLYPTVTPNGGISRQRQSGNLFGTPPPNPATIQSLGMNTAWELDFFGRVARSLQAADASIEASKEAYRDLLVTLYAETASQYIQYRTAEARLKVVRENVKVQERSLQMTKDKLDVGLVSQVDVSQALTNLESTRAAVPQFRNAMVAARNRLINLVGGDREAVICSLDKNFVIPSASNLLATGQPCDLLRSRPDIRQAERNLAAATAGIGIAEVELYPKFSLGGDFSFQSLDTQNLLSALSGGYSFGPSFSWNVFNAGQIRKLIVVEEAKTCQALAAYESAVLRGIEEVETGMASIANERDRYRILNRAVAASGEAARLVNESYRDGLIDFQRVLDAERVKFQNDDLLVVSRGQIALAYVQVYKALGGGSRVEVVPIDEPCNRPRGPFSFKCKPVDLEPTCAPFSNAGVSVQ